VITPGLTETLSEAPSAARAAGVATTSMIAVTRQIA
jgi:hypothetical protein